MTDTQLLFSADDRTGALEIGGLVGRSSAPVPVGPEAFDPTCCVLDIATRHLEPRMAREHMRQVLARPAQLRAHKMDAGLRGNWVHEVQVILDAGHKVAVICSYPDAGRRCKDGVVYIHDKPVTESVFANDPLNKPFTSRPAEALAAAGVVGDVVVWDANDNAEMFDAVRRALSEGRLVVGASGALGAVAEIVFDLPLASQCELDAPVMVACGSLNPLSRRQVEAIGERVFELGESVPPNEVSVLATHNLREVGDAKAAEVTAILMAQTIRQNWDRLSTLVVVGGDTVGALVGDDSLYVVGTVAPGIPVSEYQGLKLITKGGGIGDLDALAAIVRQCG